MTTHSCSLRLHQFLARFRSSVTRSATTALIKSQIIADVSVPADGQFLVGQNLKELT